MKAEITGSVSKLVLLMAIACGPALEGTAEWRTDPLWDDGNAEFCAYEVEWWRYGRLNGGSAQLILVKEPWAPDLDVKADTPREDGFEVLKLNHLRDVRTGIYTYHQMASVFIRRASGKLQKLAATSSEGCGISTAQVSRGILQASSYFDGQGSREMRYPKGVLAEDGLPMTLRDFLAGDAPSEIDVFPSLMAGRYPDLSATTYAVTRSEIGERRVPAGVFDAIEVRLSAGSEWQSYVFSRVAPHALVELRRSDGTVYRLAKCERIPYWQMNGEGGERWLPENLR